MEREKEAIEEIEWEISIWKQNQEKLYNDEEFFHYLQRLIDRLEDRQDKILRLEN